MDDNKHATIIQSPQGAEFYLKHGVPGYTKDRAEAIQFKSKDVALGAGLNWCHGNQRAFWDAERAAAKRQAEKFKGWTYRAEPI